jgi:hypothetical protein
MRKLNVGSLAKTVLVIGYFLVTFPLMVSAAQVTLQWDANSQAPEGYRLYQRLSSQSYNYSTPVWSGTATQCTISVNDGNTYFFVVRAYAGNDESVNSNEVSLTTGQNGTNTPPNKPSLLQPANGAVNVSLTIELVPGAYSDVNNDVHAGTRYQISTTNDFSSLILDDTSSANRTGLELPDLLLDPDTTYYWRVRFIDEHTASSDWSDPRSFTTIDSPSAGDTNGNGILDSQEVNSPIDLDQNGQDDTTQTGIVVIQTTDTTNRYIGIKRNDNAVQISAVKGYGSDGMGLSFNQPAEMTGLISFKLLLPEGMTTASVTIYFSRPAPSGAQWYKYDMENGWAVYPNASFSNDRRSVTIMLEDGGAGDQDGVCNGVIVDPSGLGYRTEGGGSGSSGGGGGGGGGCFITTTGELNPIFTEWRSYLIALLFMTIILLGCRKKRVK